MEDQKHGQGKLIYKDGSYYEGTWRNGMRDGPGSLVNSRGDRKTGQWR